MTVSSQQLTIGTAAVLIADPGDADLMEVRIRNTSATETVFLGGAGVTTATGHSVPAGQALTLQLRKTDQLHAVTAVSATITVLRMAGA